MSKSCGLIRVMNESDMIGIILPPQIRRTVQTAVSTHLILMRESSRACP